MQALYSSIVVYSVTATVLSCLPASLYIYYIAGSECIIAASLRASRLYILVFAQSQ